MVMVFRHCEESGDEEIRTSHLNWIASLSLAMTKRSRGA
jgi:hypothetical protein